MTSSRSRQDAEPGGKCSRPRPATGPSGTTFSSTRSPAIRQSPRANRSNFPGPSWRCGRRMMENRRARFQEIPGQDSMRLQSFLLRAAISVALMDLPAGTARRPRYGGTLRIEVGALLSSLDPAVAARSPEETAAKQRLDALVWEDGTRDVTSSGTAPSGPFRIAEWDPGKHATLAANDGYAGGRPYV